MTFGAQFLATTSRKLWFVCSMAAIFGVVDLLSQLVDDDSVSWANVSPLRAVAVPLGVLVLSWVFLSTLDGLGESHRKAERAPRTRLLTLLAFAIPFVCWLLQYLAFWPMASMNDTAWILDSPIGAAIQHPLTYNLTLTTIVKIGELLGGSFLAGIVFASVVQLTLWAVLVAVVIRYLASIGTRPVALWLLVAYVSVVPLVGNYSFALVKDSVFSMFLIALIPVMLHLFATRGTALRNWVFFAVATVVLVGFAVMRNNGLAVVLLVAVLIVVIANRARWLAASLLAVTVALSLVPTVATSMKFEQPKSVEAVGVPLQLIGYTNAKNPACIPKAEREFFDQIMPAADWAAAWVPASVDSTKDSALFNRDFLQSNLGEFARAWIVTGVACPAEYASAYLAHTKQLWSFDTLNAGATGGQSYFTQAVSNYPANRDALIAHYADLGVVNHSALPEPVDGLLTSFFVKGDQATPGAGFWLWAILFTIAGFVYRRRHEWIAIYAPSLLIWLTLLAAAPAVFPFRYVQFAMLVVPIGLALLFGAPPIRRMAERASTDQAAAGTPAQSISE